MIYGSKSLVSFLALVALRADSFIQSPAYSSQGRVGIKQIGRNAGPNTGTTGEHAQFHVKASWIRHRPISLGATAAFHLRAARDGAAAGDVFIAEVADFGGDFENPVVEFTATRNDKVIKAFMSAKSLSSTEKLALQAGALVQVRVVDGVVDASRGLRVELNSSPSASANSNAAAKPQLSRPTKVQSAVEPPGLVLNNLKTGTELEGKVTSSTSYAAFVNVGVFRKGKAGQYAEVNAMLHKSDLIKNTNGGTGGNHNNQRLGNGGILDRGTKVTVYVKEVLKNSGRLTVTMDPNMNKSNLLEEKERIKAEGKERRAGRRLRKQLDDIEIGSMATGVVQKVIPEGILVTVRSFGQLPISGLIGEADLPKQFEIPPGLKENFRVQLLEQDFKVGRGVICSVSKVNRHFNPAMTYNLKLEFEGFDPTIGVKDEIDDDILKDIDTIEAPPSAKMRSAAATSAKAATASVIDENDDLDDRNVDPEQLDLKGIQENLDVDGDVEEIFDELRGNQPLLPIENIYLWGDVQDMIADGEITKTILDQAIDSVGAKNGLVTLRQFASVIDTLQSVMSGEVAGEDFDDSEDDDDEANDGDDIESIYNNLKGSSKSLSVKDFKAWGEIKNILEQKLVTSEQLDAVLKEEKVKSVISFAQFDSILDKLDDLAEIVGGGEDAEGGEDEIVELSDEELQGFYDELRGSSKTLPIDKFKQWSEMKELLDDDLIVAADIDKALATAGVKRTLTFEQFLAAIDVIDEIVDRNVESFDDEEDGEEEDGKHIPDVKTVEPTSNSPTPTAKKGKVPSAAALAMASIPIPSATKVAATIEEREEEEEEEEDDDEYAEDDESFLKEVYSDIQGTAKTVTVKSVREWDEVKAMLDDGAIDKVSLDEIFKSILGSTKATSTIDFNQFVEIVSAIDEAAAGDEDEEEAEDEDEEELSPEEVKEMAKEIFDALKTAKGTVPVKTFLTWDYLIDMMDDGVIEEDRVLEFVQQVGSKANGQLTFEQFSQLLQMIDDATKEGSGSNSTDVSPVAKTAATRTLPSAGVAATTGVNQAAVEMYSQLKGKAKELAVKDFLASPLVAEIVAAKVLSKSTLGAVMQSVEPDPKGSLSLEQFMQLTQMLEDAKSLASEKKAAKGSAKADPKKSSAADTTKSSTNDDNEDDITEEDEQMIQEMRKQMFDDIKSAKGDKVSVKNFKTWEPIKELLASGELSEDDVKEAIEGVGVAALNGSLNFKQFCECLDILESQIEYDEDLDDEDDSEEDDVIELENISSGAQAASTTAGKGFGTPKQQIPSPAEVVKSSKSKKPDIEDTDLHSDDAQEDAKELYNDIRGKEKVLTVAQFKEWEDTKEMVDCGALKLSTIERGLVKVGSAQTNKITFEQFLQLMDIIQQNMDVSKLRFSEQELADGDDEGEENDDDDGEDDAVEIFNELRGKSNTVSVEKFNQWEDIQELLSCGALTPGNLSKSMKKVGIKSQITQEQFVKLLNALDEFIDHEKIPMDMDEEGEGTDEITATDEEIQSEGDESDDDNNDDDDDFEEEDVYSEDDFRAMFDELSNGKEFISDKKLLKWNDLKEMEEAGLITRNTIEKYFKQLKVKDGKIDFDTFCTFVKMLDEVLVDKEGNILDIDDRDQAIDLDAL